MERPQKKPRLGPAPHDESDDDDELNYEPEEIVRKRDPNARLARSRANAAFGLKSAFESIFERYERDFEGVADEIDLFTGDIVIDNRHLQHMRNEKDTGLVAGGAGEGALLHDSEAVTGVASPGGDEDEDQTLQGKSGALVRRAPGALVSRAPSVLGQRPGQRPGVGSLRGPPQSPPFGASPLFFGSWGPPGAMEPLWQTPQLQIPQFKSSFGTNLFTGRYQLPAREASKSIWGPSSGGDEDEDEPDEAPRMRPAPPTKKVPARPKAMKLIRTTPTNADDSGDEDCILMGVDTSLLLSTTPTSPSQQRRQRASTDGSGVPPETDHDDTEGGRETEREKAAVRSTTSRSLAITRELAEQPMRNSSVASRPSVLDGKKSPANKRRPGWPSQPGKSLVVEEKTQENMAMKPAESTPLTLHTAAQATNRNSSKVFVVELRSNHLLNNHDYLDFLDMADLPFPFDSSPSPASPDDSITLPPYDNPCQVTAEFEASLNTATDEPGDNLDQVTAEPEDNPNLAAAETGDSVSQVTAEPDDTLMSSNRIVPDSREQPTSLSSNSVPRRPMERPPERPRHKKKPSTYDLSDEELGFLSRPAQRRKRTPNVALSATNETQSPISTALTTSIDMDTRARASGLTEPTPPSASKLATQDSPGPFNSPIMTRFAHAKTHTSNRFSHRDPRSNGVEKPARCIPRRRKLTPTSLASADETESEGAPAQAGMGLSLSVTPISPPDNEAISNGAEAAKHSGVEVKTSKPRTNTKTTHNINTPLPRSTRPEHELSTRRGTRRASARESEIASMTVTGGTSTPENNQSGITNPSQREPQATAKSRGAAAAEDVAAAIPGSSPPPPGVHLYPALDGVFNVSSASRITRRRTREVANSAGPSPELPAPPFATDGRATPALDHQLPDERWEFATITTPRRELHAGISSGVTSDSQFKPATPSRTPKNKFPISDTSPSALSTGHRSLTSLVPERESLGNDSEDELTASSLWSLFQKATPALPSSGKSLHRKRGPEGTPTKAKKRVSAGRLSSGLGVERPSEPDGSVMRTPGGTIRKCGERGLKCGKDFCFTCC